MKKKNIKICITVMVVATMFSGSGCLISDFIREGNNPEITVLSKSVMEAKQEAKSTTKQEYVTYYVVNCKQSITLRPQPDVKSGEICQIPLGSAVSYVESAENGFYKIVYNGSTGYALAAYLSTDRSLVNAPIPAQANPVSYPTYYVVNCKQSITLRPGPDVSSGEICQIPLGSSVSYIESAENGFYKIIYNGSTGYALASYLSANGSSVSVPVQTNPAGYSTYYVVHCKQSITLRTSPSTSAEEICQIPLGAAVSYISAASNGFYYISYNGNTGYALASYLTSAWGYEYYDTCRVVNCKQSITLRPQPDVDSGEICQIPLGATGSYIGTASNGFYEIYYMGNHGYSLAEYLAFD